MTVATNNAAAKPVATKPAATKPAATNNAAAMIRVMLPPYLRTLAKVSGDVELEVNGLVTQRTVLDTLEDRFPMLCGTIRDHVTHARRPMVRFFACAEDVSHDS